MENYFRGSGQNPYHISIGGLIVSAEGKILAHRYKNRKMAGVVFDNIYLLLRETIEPNESIEQTLKRGMMEEFGASGKLVRYLGSIKGKMPADGTWCEKTTMYFHIEYLEHDESLRQEGSVESESFISWYEPLELAELMKKQASVDSSLDESVIIERYLNSTPQSLSPSSQG